jgi:predicted transcriptional regulator
MSDHADNLKQNLLLLGLNEDEMQVYLCLIKNKNLTALQLSRKTKIARTKIYRLLEKLVAKNLVQENIDEVGSKFSVNPFQEIEALIVKREREVEILRDKFPELIDQLMILKAEKDANTQVLFYRGKEGLEQITWNSTKAKGIFRIYEIGNMNAFTDAKFAEKVRFEFEHKKIPHRQLTTHTHTPAFLSQVSKNYWLNDDFWELRYVSPEEIDFKFEIFVYDDVYAMYTFKGDEVFCIEVHNQLLADMQKQIFDFVWNRAEKMKRVGEVGENILE